MQVYSNACLTKVRRVLRRAVALCMGMRADVPSRLPVQHWQTTPVLVPVSIQLAWSQCWTPLLHARASAAQAPAFPSRPQCKTPVRFSCGRLPWAACKRKCLAANCVCPLIYAPGARSSALPRGEGPGHERESNNTRLRHAAATVGAGCAAPWRARAAVTPCYKLNPSAGSCPLNLCPPGPWHLPRPICSVRKRRPGLQQHLPGTGRHKRLLASRALQQCNKRLVCSMSAGLACALCWAVPVTAACGAGHKWEVRCCLRLLIEHHGRQAARGVLAGATHSTHVQPLARPSSGALYPMPDSQPPHAMLPTNACSA